MSSVVSTNLNIYIHAYTHTYIDTHTYIQTYILIHIHILHTYIHTHFHAYIHTYIIINQWGCLIAALGGFEVRYLPWNRKVMGSILTSGGGL
jgi:hypothetical protein